MDEGTNCWKIFRKFWNFFDENSIEKLIFKLFLDNFFREIEASEITSLFYTNFTIWWRISHFPRRYANGRSPTKLEIFVKNGTKSQWKPPIFWKFHRLRDIFWFSEADLINDLGNLLVSRKSLGNLKEIKKPSGQILRV